MDDEDAAELKGRPARVTRPIPVGGPGEIVVAVRGGTERYTAWCHTAIAKHAPVVIVNQRSARSVDVTPFPESDAASGPG